MLKTQRGAKKRLTAFFALFVYCTKITFFNKQEKSGKNFFGA
jgi:hypothetical protein